MLFVSRYCTVPVLAFSFRPVFTPVFLLHIFVSSPSPLINGFLFYAGRVWKDTAIALASCFRRLRCLARVMDAGSCVDGTMLSEAWDAIEGAVSRRCLLDEVTNSVFLSFLFFPFFLLFVLHLIVQPQTFSSVVTRLVTLHLVHGKKQKCACRPQFVAARRSQKILGAIARRRGRRCSLLCDLLHIKSRQRVNGTRLLVCLWG